MNTTQSKTKTGSAAKGGSGAAALALRLPPNALIGDTLYLFGFWVEYWLLCAGRAIVRLAKAVWRYTSFLLLAILRPIAQVLVGFFRGLARPVAQLRADLRTLREAIPDLADLEPAQRQALRREYSKNRRALYRRLLWEGFSFLLPVAAALALFAVVRIGSGLHFALNVQVNGESVGYVQSEQVFESARTDVQSRLNNARAAILAKGGAVDDEQWDLSTSYTLAIADETMNENEVANAIMSVSSDEIGQGTAVYVDGDLQFVTTEGDHLRTYLENIKAPYLGSTDINTHVSFLHDIELEDGIYMLSSMEDYDKVVSTFNENPEVQYYTAGRKETVETAVANTGLSFDSLAQMNPGLLTLDQAIPEGTQLVTGASSPEWLKVKVVRRQTYPEDIPYQTEERTSGDYEFGQRIVVQEGQTGLQEVTQDITYIDGNIASAEIVNVDVISQPVTEIVIRGTHLQSGLYASVGSGSFVWPVPGYRGVSRWASGSHKGADIFGAYGTPIIAADSGAVVTATNGAGTSRWGYGIYVVIDHGNGWTTLYGHMSSLAVSAGQSVEKGQIIGYMGSTGRSTGNHCHFEMYQNGVLYSARNLWPNM